MKKTFFIVLYITFASAAYAQTNTPEAKAAFKRFLDFYAQNNADSIFMLFSEDTQNILPLNKTRQFISQMHSQLGSIIKSEYSAASADYNVYKSYFEKPGYALFLNFDQNNKIIGLFLKPEEDIKTTDTLLSPDNISLKTEYGTLYGTLTLPDTTAKIPVVLIIGGSGPTDRNNNSSLGLKTNAFLMLAEALRSNGIAVLRYDKQGAGKSRSSKKESELRFSDFVNDASRFINLLNKDERFSKVIVLGHSEGSLVGMLAVQQQHADAFISLSGAGFTADSILKRQLKGSLSEPLYQSAEKILDSLKHGERVKQNIPAELFPLFHQEVQPYLISWMKYEPSKEMTRLNIPVLILQGTTDLQVSMADAKALKQAQPKARLELIEGMNHVLKKSPADPAQNMQTYGEPQLPLHQELTDKIVQFIKALNK